MASPSVLVTGASGFLGRHLLEALAGAEGASGPLALVRDEKAWRELDWTAGVGAEPVVGSVLEPEAWAYDERIRGVRAIYHLAAVVQHSRLDAQDVYRTNVMGTLHMVRLAARLGSRMVFVSTSGTVGCFERADQSADEESPLCDERVAPWPYYDSKVQAERAARQLADDLRVDLVFVRPPVLLGPGDHRFRSTGHILRMLRGKLPFLIEGGIHFVDIRDAARALVAVMERPEVRPVYHLPGTACSIQTFFAMVEDASGVAPPSLRLPYGPAHLLARLTRRLGWLPDPVVIEMARHYWDVSSRYAESDLDFRPRGPAETIGDTVRWLQEHHPELAAAPPG